MQLKFKSRELFMHTFYDYYMDETDFNNLRFGQTYYVDGKKLCVSDVVLLNDDIYKCFNNDGFISLELFGDSSHEINYDYMGNISVERFYIEDDNGCHNLLHNENGPALIKYDYQGVAGKYYLYNREMSKKEWEEQIATKLYW